MDLRAVLNTDGGGNASASKQQPPPVPPPTRSSSSTTQGSVAAAPVTPIQTVPPPLAFRDYATTTHASPVAQPQPHPHEYPQGPPLAPSQQTPYASPTTYHAPANAFAARPSVVPPLQPPGPHDIRSPGSASISGPSYRHTPTSSVSNASGGFPFPPSQQPPTSPVQRHQYGHPAAYPRDSYPSQQQPPPPAPGASVSYMQGQQPPQLSMPQTPPVGTPGGSQQYLHQRSMSIQSTSTPTSAHSQPPGYGPPYVQGSPVTATHHPPHLVDQHQQPQPQQHPHYQRQTSQPPTPLGPPPRQSPATAYQQLPSPYQHRVSTTSTSANTAYHPPPPHQSMQSSPPPPPPSAVASVTRMSIGGGHSAYDAVAESHRRSQSQQSRSERERSLSVSPKTRVPSLPNNAGQRPLPSGEADPLRPSHLPPVPAAHSIGVMDSQRELTPAKRKLDERDLRPDELENHRQAPPPPQLNGNYIAPSPVMPSHSSSPMIARRKRIVHATPPAWAESGKNRPPTTSRNFSMKHATRQPPTRTLTNGGSQTYEAGGSVKSEHASRHASPEATRSIVSVKTEDPNPSIKELPTFNGQPFPWEPSLEASRPIEMLSRCVADFLVFNVLQYRHLEEALNRGVQFEIEAKLGTIIDKATNDRIYFPVKSGECVLGDEARIAFRSSMTEHQHHKLNEYLNERVKSSFQKNPTGPPRVPIQYVHRREIDRFFELPAQMRQRLPACVSSLQQPNSPLKARVTYDQKTGAVLAKIVKARVADLHIHFPHLLLDCRISVNLEHDWDGPADEIERAQIPNKDRSPDRLKDRLSYKHGFYQVDLTQVTHGRPTQSGQGMQPDLNVAKEHELEVELDSRTVIQHGRLVIGGEENKYTDLVEGLVDNVRLLARNCPPPHM
ncbi:mRNA triphosphatase CET1 [Whalleya microplaca]|nr:mRNA triphosphatase CET1 [Whalleya microplaca]